MKFARSTRYHYIYIGTCIDHFVEVLSKRIETIGSVFSFQRLLLILLSDEFFVVFVMNGTVMYRGKILKYMYMRINISESYH